MYAAEQIAEAAVQHYSASLHVLCCQTVMAYFALQSGEAMSLECQCRGELALRHRSCAEKWSRVKVC